MLRLITHTGAAMIATALLVAPFGVYAAETTEALLTWQAHSLVPPAYMGRVLPTTGSPITVSAQLLENRTVVAAPAGVFRWYVNGFLLREGEGLTRIQFTGADVPGTGGSYAVELVLRGYTDRTIRSAVTIPRVNPRLVLTTALPGNTLRLAGTLVTALPYFFNVRSSDELSFAWRIGGAERQTTDNSTLVSGSSELTGRELSISATATGPQAADRASATISAFSQ